MIAPFVVLGSRLSSAHNSWLRLALVCCVCLSVFGQVSARVFLVASVLRRVFMFPLAAQCLSLELFVSHRLCSSPLGFACLPLSSLGSLCCCFASPCVFWCHRSFGCVSLGICLSLLCSFFPCVVVACSCCPSSLARALTCLSLLFGIRTCLFFVPLAFAQLPAVLGYLLLPFLVFPCLPLSSFVPPWP